MKALFVKGLSPELMAGFKALCAAKGVTLQEGVRLALGWFVDKQKLPEASAGGK